MKVQQKNTIIRISQKSSKFILEGKMISVKEKLNRLLFMQFVQGVNVV
jgi:hypothetical protein